MTDKLPYARSFQDLLAYIKSVILAERVFNLTKQFPKRGGVFTNRSNLDDHPGQLEHR